MKKIVALVLALVLALSLATVAFAADESYFAAKVGGMKLTGVTLKEVKAAGEKNVTVYAPVVTVNGKEIPMALNLVEATDADYDYVFVSGKTVTYLKNSINGQYTGEAKAVSGLALKQADDATCGDIIINKDVALYEMNGKYYKAVGSWNLRTVLGNATKDYVNEYVQQFTYTKADWDAAVAHYMKTDAYTAITGLLTSGISVNTVSTLLKNAFDAIWGYAGQSYGAEATVVGAYHLDDLYNAFVDALAAFEADGDEATGAFNIFYSYYKDSDFEKLGMHKRDFFTRLMTDIKEDVIANVLEALGIPAPADPDAWMLGTNAEVYGWNPYLNVAREVLKQGASVKALALVDGKLITLAAADAATKVTKSYDAKTGALTATIDGDYYVVPHKYAADYATVAGKTALTKVYCETCKAEFDFVVGDETAAVEKFGAGNFENITNEFKYAFTTKFLGKHAASFDWGTMSFGAEWLDGTGYTWNMFDQAARNVKTALDGKQLYIGTAAAAEAEVESAKTFDAGVALYAGMALMSVAGSAVVIGKKKEF